MASSSNFVTPEFSWDCNGVNDFVDFMDRETATGGNNQLSGGEARHPVRRDDRIGDAGCETRYYVEEC